ncbi:MAG: NAD(P)H-dependent oxidoreductase [Thermoleophilia bacterium]|nr:NAD(P)H-dependent oxidoreductase [Thermoleophilia bacterium]
MTPLLQIVIASTRPGRVGLPVGEWVAQAATSHGAFDVELVDLKQVDLPLLDEPNHPRQRRYEHDHTKAWSRRVEAADAFVFVTCEYNFGMPAPLKNAIDYLNQEWAYRPAAICSYGGVSAGLRASAQLKQVLQAVSVPVIQPAFSIPFVKQFISDDGQRFEPNDVLRDAAPPLFDELARWEQALRPLRAR